MNRPVYKIVTPTNSWRIALILCVLCVLCGKSAAQDFKTVARGVEYAEVTREIDKQQVRMNLLRLDLTKVRLDVVHAMDAAIGLEKTSSIAKRHGAFAAINGGFFRLDDSIWAGDPQGVFQVDGHLLSESDRGRVALGIKNEAQVTTIEFGHLETKLKIYAGVDAIFVVDGINRERRDGEIVIFTPTFGRSTLTDPTGSEFAVVVPKKSIGGNVKETRNDLGSSPIPADGFVISAKGGQETVLGKLLGKLTSLASWNVGYDALEIDKLKFLESAEDMVGGIPQLIKDGKIDITWEEEKTNLKFVETRHPRTAVAKLKDGKFLMITVDGRSESSGGISLTDLAAYLLQLGATDAMNLDGGGSSTMFLDGKVVNQPSDKEGERKVSDAILVTLRPARKNK